MKKKLINTGAGKSNKICPPFTFYLQLNQVEDSMDKLMVKETKSRSFLDQVVAHGIQHNLFPHEFRKKLAEDAAKATFFLGKKLAENMVDLEAALKISRLVRNFISFVLEAETGGNIILATAFLKARPIDEIVMMAQKMIDAQIKEIVEYERASKKVYFVKQEDIEGAYFCITYGRENIFLPTSQVNKSAKEALLGLLNDVNLWDKPYSWVEIYESLSKYEDFMAIRDIMKILQEETRIVKLYLPWEKLYHEAKLIAPAGENITASLLQSSFLEVGWSAESFMLTL